MEVIYKLIHKTKYIGEIGLDGAKKYKDHWDIQTLVFRHILNSCEIAGGKILSIHSRYAVNEVLDYLEQYPKAGIFILHWFTGNKLQLKRAVKLGCWFSVGPAMLRSKKAKELILEIPLNRLITETDGPFVQVNKKIVMPWDVSLAIQQLSTLLDITSDDVDKLICANASKLFI